MTDSCWTHLSTVLKLCKWQLTQTLIAMCVGSLCLFRSHVQQDLTDLFVRQNASSESVPIKVLPMKGVAETWHMPRYSKGEGTGACSRSEHMFLVIVVRIVKKKKMELCHSFQTNSSLLLIFIIFLKSFTKFHTTHSNIKTTEYVDRHYLPKQHVSPFAETTWPLPPSCGYCLVRFRKKKQKKHCGLGKNHYITCN